MSLWEWRQVTWRHRLKGKTHVMRRAKTGPMQLYNTWRMERQPWRPAGGKGELHPETQGAWPWGCRDFWLPAFKIVRRCVSVVPSPQVSATWINQPWETNSRPSCFPDTWGPDHEFTASTRVVPTRRFFPTLALQAWTQSLGSWLKCCFLKDALWACSAWTSGIHLFLALSRGGTQGWWGSLRNQLCAASPQTSPLTTSSQDSASFPPAWHWTWAPTSLLTETFPDCPSPCTPRLYLITLFYSSKYPLNYTDLVFISHLHTDM